MQPPPGSGRRVPTGTAQPPQSPTSPGSPLAPRGDAPSVTTATGKAVREGPAGIANGQAGGIPARAALRHTPPAPGQPLATRVAEATGPAGAAPAAPAPEEPASKVAQIRRMLAGADRGRMVQFQAFLTKEYAAENLDFLLAIGRMDEGGSLFAGDRLDAARALCETFVKDGTDRQVNLSGPNRQAVLQRLETAQRALAAGQSLTLPLRDLDQAIGEAHKEILSLLAADSFGRFLAQEARD